MNLEELIREAASRSNTGQRLLKKHFFVFVATILAALKRGEEVKIRGIGKFVPLEKKPRNCRNPRTGGKTVSRNRKTVGFKASKNLDIK